MVILTFPHEQVEVFLPGRDPIVLTADDVLAGFRLAVSEVLG